MRMDNAVGQPDLRGALGSDCFVKPARAQVSCFIKHHIEHPTHPTKERPGHRPGSDRQRKEPTKVNRGDSCNDKKHPNFTSREALFFLQEKPGHKKSHRGDKEFPRWQGWFATQPSGDGWCATGESY